MTETQQFIEDVLAGGFDSAVLREHLADIKDMGFITIHTVGWMFLVPDVWQACGRTRGWEEHRGDAWDDPDWSTKWHRFIDHLADGKTIEESLLAIK